MKQLLASFVNVWAVIFTEVLDRLGSRFDPHDLGGDDE